MENNAMEKDTLSVLKKVNAVITGSHIVYTSGKHGTAYVNKDAIYPHTQDTSDLCVQFAHEFKGKGIDVVIAPAVGGVILSQWTAFHLSNLTGREILGVYAEKTDGDSFVIKRGYDKLIQQKRVLVVEDILTTGGSVRKVVEAVRNIGGEVVGVAALCNRGGITAADIGDVPELVALANVTLEAWDAADCPLCKQGVPVNIEVGKGREFLASKQRT